MEKKTNEKKVLVLSFLGVLTFIAVVVGATYAYFTAQGGGTGNINVNATTNTTDNLSFQVGNAISLTANQEVCTRYEQQKWYYYSKSNINCQ